jgi:hypothetical protein
MTTNITISRRQILLLLLSACLLFSACKQAKPTGQQSPEPAAPPLGSVSLPPGDRATAEWARHFEVVERAAAGSHANDEFSQACGFFEELTGIVVHGDGNTFGWFPTKQTASDIPLLRGWYAANKHRLYWDEPVQKVRVRPAPG